MLLWLQWGDTKIVIQTREQMYYKFVHAPVSVVASYVHLCAVPMISHGDCLAPMWCKGISAEPLCARGWECDLRTPEAIPYRMLQRDPIALAVDSALKPIVSANPSLLVLRTAIFGLRF